MDLIDMPGPEDPACTIDQPAVSRGSGRRGRLGKSPTKNA